jgi:hypothetical protein
LVEADAQDWHAVDRRRNYRRARSGYWLGKRACTRANVVADCPPYSHAKIELSTQFYTNIYSDTHANTNFHVNANFHSITNAYPYIDKHPFPHPSP